MNDFQQDDSWINIFFNTNQSIEYPHIENIKDETSSTTIENISIFQANKDIQYRW